MRVLVFIPCFFLIAVPGRSQSLVDRQAATPQRTAYVSQIIDLAVNPSQLPAGFKGLVVGYLDDFGPVYKSYGVATVDRTVTLDEKMLFGIGSLTKLFARRCPG